jgi:ribosomal protein L28
VCYSFVVSGHNILHANVKEKEGWNMNILLTKVRSMKAVKRICIVTSLISVVILTLCGCSKNVTEETAATGLDYSLESNWLALPADADERNVDVFYVYPTIYQGDGLQDVTDADQITASQVPLRTQASVFADSANIYAPMYRQVGRAGFENTEELDSFLQVGEQDVKTALSYYLENYNNGKPFIIAGHSQGSSTLISLLTRIWGTTGAEDRMIPSVLT